jgi:hypothetical protein
MVEICGGETGLIDNIGDVVSFLKSHKSVKKTQIMSNGLLRVKHPDIITEFDFYNEHLVRDIVGVNVHKFHDMDYCDAAKTVVVMTENTTRSLLEYPEQYAHMINSDKFWFKMFVERKLGVSTSHVRMMREFYNNNDVLHADYYKKMLTFPADKFARAVCAKSPFLPCIDLVNDKMIHCAYHNFTDDMSVTLTEDNLRGMVNKRLFMKESPSYCDSCNDYYHDPHFLMRKNRSNRQI